MKKILFYYFLMIIAVCSFYFVDSRAENIWGFLSPFLLVILILYIYFDLLKEKNDERERDAAP
ncbi:MAG: hypothetical protein WC002_01460 [Candidatus Muiribacteriota bacterium]